MFQKPNVLYLIYMATNDISNKYYIFIPASCQFVAGKNLVFLHENLTETKGHNGLFLSSH